MVVVGEGGHLLEPGHLLGQYSIFFIYQDMLLWEFLRQSLRPPFRVKLFVKILVIIFLQDLTKWFNFAT